MKSLPGIFLAVVAGFFGLTAAAQTPVALLDDLNTLGTAGKQLTLLTTGQ